VTVAWSWAIVAGLTAALAFVEAMFACCTEIVRSWFAMVCSAVVTVA
jgi:hypothetical protein